MPDEQEVVKEAADHEHIFNTPIDVFDDPEGIEHHRETTCGICGEIEPKPKAAVKPEPAPARAASLRR